MSTEKIDKLVNQGRALLTSSEDVVHIHYNFEKWLETVEGVKLVV